MNDSYVELLVKCKENTGALVLRSVLYALGVLFLFLSLATGIGLAMIVAAIFAGAGYYVSLASKIEYEYLYLEKKLSIDRIKNQTKRATIAEYDLMQVEIVAPADSYRLDQFKNNPQVKTVDYSSRSVASKPFAMFFRKGETWEKVLIEMSEDLFEQMNKTLPRKIFKD